MISEPSRYNLLILTPLSFLSKLCCHLALPSNFPVPSFPPPPLLSLSSYLFSLLPFTFYLIFFSFNISFSPLSIALRFLSPLFLPCQDDFSLHLAPFHTFLAVEISSHTRFFIPSVSSLSRYLPSPNITSRNPTTTTTPQISMLQDIFPASMVTLWVSQSPFQEASGHRFFATAPARPGWTSGAGRRRPTRVGALRAPGRRQRPQIYHRAGGETLGSVPRSGAPSAWAVNNASSRC